MNEEGLLDLQTLSYQIQQLQEQLQIIENQFTELSILSSALDEVKESKGKNSLIPLGPGIFAEAELKDTDKVLVNVGSEIMVRKTIQEAKELIEKQIEETRSLAELFKHEIEHSLEGLKQY
ncbi:MAG: prefoldin subunit alpha [Candidatus Nanoarchaeia archaeon]|nr:prefoldin subunit alpha [Candidatus Nanoarchaeia archaeon]